jgi:hypothetical protein
VQVLGRGDAERALQENLPGRRRQEVGAAHDRRHALQRIVDDDRELVGEPAVGAAHDEVADLARDVLALRPLRPSTNSTSASSTRTRCATWGARGSIAAWRHVPG